MKLETSAPAHDHGKERNCQHCGTAYRSPRASSLYCGATCRKAANRAAKVAPRTEGSLILRALMHLGMVGKVGANELALTVRRSEAFDELALIFNRKGWGLLTEAEFGAALAAGGVKAR